MRVAWFHPAPANAARAGDDVCLLVDELRRGIEIDLIDEPRAHEFVWRHARRPYDLCVYELADTPAHRYVWPYLLHVPGIVSLRATSLRVSRSDSLAKERRDGDYRAELAFGGRPMLRAPLAASHLVVVFDAALARALEQDYPGLRVAVAPIGIEPAPAHLRPSAPPHLRTPAPSHPRFGILEPTDVGLVERAAARAREAGATFDLLVGLPLEDTIRDADVTIALEWPPTGAPLMNALVAMASSLPCVVLETEATAAWPALDPQTWQPRDPMRTATPIVVSLDPRDDEHSLVLAMRRLSADRALRQALGAAAHAWWAEHATVEHAAAAWRRILQDAMTMSAPSRPAHWPRHLTADGTEHAREILGEFGVGVDFLDWRERR